MAKERLPQIVAPLGGGSGITSDGRLVTGVTGHGRALSLSDGRVAMPGGRSTGRSGRDGGGAGGAGGATHAAWWATQQTFGRERPPFVGIPAVDVRQCRLSMAGTADILREKWYNSTMSSITPPLTFILNRFSWGYFYAYGLHPLGNACRFAPQLVNQSLVAHVYPFDDDNSTTYDDLVYTDNFLAILARYQEETARWITANRRLRSGWGIGNVSWNSDDAISQAATSAQGQIVTVSPNSYDFLLELLTETDFSYGVALHVPSQTSFNVLSSELERYHTTLDYETSSYQVYTGRWVTYTLLHTLSAEADCYALVSSDVVEMDTGGTFDPIWRLGISNLGDHYSNGVISDACSVYCIFLAYRLSEGGAWLRLVCLAYPVVNGVADWNAPQQTARDIQLLNDTIQVEVVSMFGGETVVSPLTVADEAPTIPAEQTRPAVGASPYIGNGMWLAGGELPAYTQTQTYHCMLHVTMTNADGLPVPVPYSQT